MKPKVTDRAQAEIRIAAATSDFEALLRRHRVTYGIETGENSVTGKFSRIFFCVPLPNPASPTS